MRRELTARLRLRLAPFLVLLVCAVFALGACGGDDGGDEPSKDEFIEQADNICKDAQEDAEAIEQPSEGASPDELVAYVDEVKELGEEVQADLEDLEAPSDVEDDFNQYLENVDEVLGKLDELRDAAETTDEAQIEQIDNEIDEISEENQDLAQDIGFKECGEET